ncbi:outer membrane protein assembly factor BamB family protein [Enhygromyxa salina]|uniref:Pyrrolo-quinoline quinone repeat domain-containing protein n=1 Tax=Enhygromyxa salina TaxID=215803 RepID=A0A2S9XTU0_9BACT|nr:PQQ-binding-like beta-propeller repeat protein [Enhygromyxa salina]PRP96272.1 hypothetical protein ENSA7_70870 [Enhygromyxa salina]
MLIATGALGCGPGGFAFDGSSFGDTGTGFGSETATSSDDPASSSASSANPDPGTDTDSSDDWIETETDTGEPEPPEPLDPPECERTWTHLDTTPTHGHLGNTPIGGRSDGGFVSVNPVIGAGNDEVNVDAWFRSWSATGVLEWERYVSWADHRDDPLVIVQDDLADLFIGGRTNANMVFEDAIVAALDGLSGDLRWTHHRGDGGAYTSLLHTGAALLAVGQIGSFGALGLELIAFDPDTGAVLWSVAPELDLVDVATRGVVMSGGLIDVLVADSSGGGELQILRFEPPSTATTQLVSLATGDPFTPHALAQLDTDSLVALYSVGANETSSFLAVVERDSGQQLDSLAFGDLIQLLPDDLGEATNVEATQLVITPDGLGVAGTLWGEDNERKTFVLRLDSELNPLCVGVMGKDDVEGLFHPPLLRGLTVGPTGELVTGSFASNPRRSVFARWN